LNFKSNLYKEEVIMPRFLRDAGLILSSILLFSTIVLAAEEMTITTYYPSPYGSYNELTTASNTYLATASGSVGIGTTSLTTGKLVVSGGNVDVTGNRITNVAAPSLGTDAVNRDYVDAAGGGKAIYHTTCFWSTMNYQKFIPPLPTVGSCTPPAGVTLI